MFKRMGSKTKGVKMWIARLAYVGAIIWIAFVIGVFILMMALVFNGAKVIQEQGLKSVVNTIWEGSGK